MTYRYPDALVIQFAKAPRPGRVKTRMRPELDDQSCVALHRRLVTYTFDKLSQTQLCPLELWVDELHYDGFFTGLRPQRPVRRQCGADLGARMYHALATALADYQRVVLVGSDCPFLNPGHIEEALARLGAGDDVVLGPAMDGGYVLIGARRVDNALFSGVPWGTGGVLTATRGQLRALAWRWSELPPLADIDTAADLKLIQNLENF